MNHIFQQLLKSFATPAGATPPALTDDGLDRPLLWFGPKDTWKIRDACEGTAVFGATGSGKTSGSGRAIAHALLKAGCGGLVMCAKPDEVENAYAHAAEFLKARLTS